MKKNRWWMLLLCLCSLMLVACSAPMPGEDVGQVQQAIGTCPRPTGGGGDTVWPVDSYVSAFGVDPTASWRMVVKSKLVTSPFTVTTTYVDFGGTNTTHSQAKMSGPGWSSGAGRRIVELETLTSNSPTALAAGCLNDSNLVCLFGWEDALSTPFPILYFDKSKSFPGGTHFYASGGLTAIVGIGATTPQAIRWYGDWGGSPFATRTMYFQGPALDSCFWP